MQAHFDEIAVIALVVRATGLLARTGIVATMTTMECLVGIRIRIMISRIWKYKKNVVPLQRKGHRMNILEGLEKPTKERGKRVGYKL